jgi:hypothetical protein
MYLVMINTLLKLLKLTYFNSSFISRSERFVLRRWRILNLTPCSEKQCESGVLSGINYDLPSMPGNLLGV